MITAEQARAGTRTKEEVLASRVEVHRDFIRALVESKIKDAMWAGNHGTSIKLSELRTHSIPCSGIEPTPKEVVEHFQPIVDELHQGGHEIMQIDEFIFIRW